MRILISAAVVAAAGVFAAGEAEACSALSCVEGYLYPAPDQTIPSNATGVIWRPTADVFGFDPDDVEISLVDSTGRPRALELENSSEYSPGYFVRVESLAPGSYTFRARDLCMGQGDRTRESVFHVGPAAAVPQQLGRVIADAPVAGTAHLAESAACNVSVPATLIDLHLELSPEVEPWRELLLIRTYVDGARWRPSDFLPREIPLGGSWVGRYDDRLYVQCGGQGPAFQSWPELSEGPHRVKMQAFLPGLGIELETAEIVVDLQCDLSSTQTDGGSGGGLTGEPGPLQPGTGGCGCTAADAHEGRGSAPWGATLLVAGLALRRRRGSPTRRAA